MTSGLAYFCGEVTMGITIEKAERAASRSLRFLFAPQLLSGTKSPRMLFAAIVQMFASFLASAQLIPATHRSLRPLTPRDANLGEVMALAYATVRSPGARVDQMAIFGIVSGLMGLLALQSVYMVASLFVGTAHAAIDAQAYLPAIVCMFNDTPGGYFTAPCASDMAQNWIDSLLLGDVSSSWFNSMVMSMPLRDGMSAMFTTYSYAMLVLAGFLVMYHLLTVIAGTAHEGRLGGKVMNQIWAPIRLIAAIAMLVPMTSNGLNGGQYVVVQAAKMGSALASNTWLAFAQKFTDSSVMNLGAFIILPPLQSATPTVRGVLDILVCKAVFANAADKIGTTDFSVTPSGWFAEGNTIAGNAEYIKMTFDYYNSVSDDSETAACGSITLPNPDYDPKGSYVSYISDNDWYNKAYTMRKIMLNGHKDAINNLLKDDSDLSKLAKALVDSADTANSDYKFTEDDAELFNNAVGSYLGTISSKMFDAVDGSGLDSYSMVASAYARGWVSASVWFNSVSRINGMLMDFVQLNPIVNPDAQFGIYADDQVAEVGYMALDMVDNTLGMLPVLSSTGSKTFTLYEPDQLSNDLVSATKGQSSITGFLTKLASNFKETIGGTTGSSGTGPADLSGISGYAKPLQLNTSNPLAELSAVGLRLIKLALKSTEEMENCMTMAAMNAEKLEKTPKGDRADLSKQAGACGAKSYTGIGPSVFIIQSVVGAMIAAGVTLGFVLPLIPFIRFLFGMMTWILSMFESVIAIPVVALAHIKMDGDGIAGPTARTAYLLVLQVFLRPVLMIFGLILALLLFNVMIIALNEFYAGAVRSSEAGGSMGAVATVVYTVIYGALAYALANASFKAIDIIPAQCLKWIGGPGQESIDGLSTVQGATSQTSAMASNAMLTQSQNQARAIAYRSV